MNLRRNRNKKEDLSSPIIENALLAVDDINALADNVIDSVNIKLKNLFLEYQTLIAILSLRADELEEHKKMIVEDYAHYLKEVTYTIINRRRRND